MNQYRVNKEHGKSSRSRPVSCYFCRARKLKCNRQFPCSNCTSRGITCQLYETTSPAAASADPQNEPDGSSGGFNADVLARIRRLEDIVIGAKSASFPSRPAHAPSFGGPPLPNGEQEHISPGQHSTTTDADRLEFEITHSSQLNPLVADDIEFRICPIQNASELNSRNTLATRCIWLPLYEESREIVEKYLADITYLHHVVRAPAVRILVDDIYRDLGEGKPHKVGDIALLLAILSSTTFLWAEGDMGGPLFSTLEEANGQSPQWTKLTFETLDYTRRMRSESMEDIQAMIIILFVLFNLTGFTSQTHSLLSTAISVAKQLSLHRIDLPRSVAPDPIPPDSVQAEMGRRLWWYLAATDWQMSQFAGPQKGTYIINPRHMATNKPVNANDEDLVDGMVGVAQPNNQPTTISYCLHRIRLGELCREIADCAPPCTSASGTPTFQQVKELDVKLCELAGSLPSFFSLDHEPRNLPDNDPRKYPGIVMQRYLITPLLYAQRCRLHLPYLSRVSKEPAYTYSREACLDAARMVIRAHRQLFKENLPFAWIRLRFTGALHCVCMAIIVFLIDFSLEKDSQSEGESMARPEIFDAFKILEDAKGQSPFAQRLFKSFKAVLRQHNIPVGGSQGDAIDSRDHKLSPLSESAIESSAIPVTGSAGGNPENPLLDSALPSFDDLLQAFDDNVDSATVDWNALFADFNAPMR